jgi:hypothetical protein
MALSVPGTVRHRTVVLFVNNELEEIRKEAVMA